VLGGIFVFDKNHFVDGVIEQGLGLTEVAERRSLRSIDFDCSSYRGSGGYGRYLRSLVFFLECEFKAKPTRMSVDDFQILLRLAQHLVDTGEIRPAVLELFSAGQAPLR
jgi:hypothetical protein